MIDAGVGAYDPGNPGRLLVRLADAGVDPASIDKVILTHADVDHIGGAARPGGQLAFSNSEHWMTQTEFGFWRQLPVRLRPSPLYSEEFRSRVNSVPPTVIDALGDRLLLIDEQSAEIMPGVTLIAAPGHTPGNAIVRIESSGDVLLVVADLFYQRENLANEDWVSQYDYDPVEVVETRRKLLEEAATTHALLMGYHLPFPGLGRVARNRQGWRWIPI